TGLRRELVTHLAGHMDVNALDAYGLDPAVATAVEETAAENVKRLVRPPVGGADAVDWLSPEAQSPYLIGEFTETKTVWHPIGG
ncbi:MAG TPA: aldehyde dehydrogenase, partial [Candidatus Limnocylindria bacterium]